MHTSAVHRTVFTLIRFLSGMSNLMVVPPMTTSFTSALLGTCETVTVLAAPEHNDIAVSQFHHKNVFEADLLAAPL